MASNETAAVASATLPTGAGVMGPAQQVFVTGALQQQWEVPQHCPSFAQAVPGRRSKSSRLSARFLTSYDLPDPLKNPSAFWGKYSHAFGA